MADPPAVSDMGSELSVGVDHGFRSSAGSSGSIWLRIVTGTPGQLRGISDQAYCRCGRRTSARRACGEAPLPWQTERMLSPDDHVQRSSSPFTTEASDELVMLDASQGRYFGLNAPGRRIWELLEHETTSDAICTILVREFQVSLETCRHEVAAYLQKLHENQLLTARTPR